MLTVTKGKRMIYEYLFFTIGVIFFAYMLLEDEIRFYRLMSDKKKYWEECFPRFLSNTKKSFIKVLIGILLIIAWIYLPEIARALFK